MPHFTPMKSFRPNYLAASIACLCGGATARLEAAHPVAEAAPAYGPLDGTLFLELGFTADRIEGQTNLLAPLYRGDDGKNMFFLDGNWSGKGDGNENGSAGLGYRHRFANPDLIFGVNAFYDYGDYSGHGYPQFGAGLELLSKWVDFRANGYFPDQSVNHFDRHHDTSFHGSASNSTSVATTSRIIDGGEGGQMLQTTTTTTHTADVHGTRRRVRHEQQEAALPGFDSELGFLVPYVSCFAETRLYAGYAFFDEPFGNDISCFTARLESRRCRRWSSTCNTKATRAWSMGTTTGFSGRARKSRSISATCSTGKAPSPGSRKPLRPRGSAGRRIL